MTEGSEDFQVMEFIGEWLNHMNITFDENIKIKSQKLTLNFLIPTVGTGILVSQWKKPFSVQALNKSLRLYDQLNLTELVIIAQQVSEHAIDTINRIKVNISIIHPHNLSELAMRLVGVSKSEPPITAES